MNEELILDAIKQALFDRRDSLTRMLVIRQHGKGMDYLQNPMHQQMAINHACAQAKLVALTAMLTDERQSL